MTVESEYQQWLESEQAALSEEWEAMGEDRRYEEGTDFGTFCRNQYDDYRDFSNS